MLTIIVVRSFFSSSQVAEEEGKKERHKKSDIMRSAAGSHSHLSMLPPSGASKTMWLKVGELKLWDYLTNCARVDQSFFYKHHLTT